MSQCKRSGCPFNNNGFDYCCRTCSNGQGHGTGCQQQLHIQYNNQVYTQYVPQHAVQGQGICRVPNCSNAIFRSDSRGCTRTHHMEAVNNNYQSK